MNLGLLFPSFFLFFFWYCAVGIISFLFQMSSLANKEDKKFQPEGCV